MDPVTTDASTAATTTGAGNLHRGRVAAVCMFTQVILGMLYTWTVFRAPLAKLHGWSEAQTIAPYRYSLMFLALGTVIAGIVHRRKGPRFVEVISGLLMGTGMLLASFLTDSVTGLILSYGLLGGLGVGFGYVAPIATCIKWFPDRPGFIAGLAIVGSGIGPLFYGPFLQSLIGRDPTQYGASIPRTFLILAGLFYVAMLGAAQFYRLPPPGWTPVGYSPARAKEDAAPGHDVGIGGMLGTWQFYVLYLMYFMGASVGLTTIGMAAPLLDTAGAAAAAVSIGLSVGLVSVFNASGRLSFGAFSDRFGRKATIMLMSAVSVVACLVFLRPVAGFWPVMTGLFLAAFSYGGWVALMPTVVADYYGKSTVGSNYGVLFSSWGLVGFIAPGYFAAVLDSQRATAGVIPGYGVVFTQLAILGAGAFVLAAILRKPRLT